MVKQDTYRNVPPFITGPGLHYVDPMPVMHEDGELRKPKRPYQHLLVQDTSNGAPRTTITPVTVEERDGMFICTPYRLYAHHPPQSYDVTRPIEEVEPSDFNCLPVLLFPGDTLIGLGGLETVTVVESNQEYPSLSSK